MDADLFAGERLARPAQMKACQEMVDAVNRVVHLQFQLDMDVLKCAVNCQTEAYRALHAAKTARRQA